MQKLENWLVQLKRKINMKTKNKKRDKELSVKKWRDEVYNLAYDFLIIKECPNCRYPYVSGWKCSNCGYDTGE